MMRRCQIIKALILCLAFIFVVTVLPGCSKEKPLISLNIEELSLVDMWRTVVQTTGVQEPKYSYLESMRLRARDGKIQYLDFAFYIPGESEPTMYHTFFDEKGKLDWFSGQIKNGGSIPLSFNPEIVFTQIDRFGLTNIRPEVSGFTIEVRKQTGVQFVYKLFSLYRLEDGILTPLALVKLNSERPGLPIQVGSIAISRPPEGQFETYTEPEYWFLGEDINKAERVEYLEN
jgi:hypothetical protein